MDKNKLILEFGLKLYPIFVYYDPGEFLGQLRELREKTSFPPINIKSNYRLQETKYRFILNGNVILTKYLPENGNSDMILNDLMEIVNSDDEKILKWKGNLENIDSWIDDICLFITSQQDVSVGIKYISGVTKAPVLLSRQYKCGNIASIAIKNKVPTILLPPLARAIYSSTNINEYVNQEYWLVLIKIFDQLAEKNKIFREKTKMDAPKHPLTEQIPIIMIC